MAKFCTNCGSEVKDGIAFCSECGTKVAENVSTVHSENSNVDNKESTMEQVAGQQPPSKQNVTQETIYNQQQQKVVQPNQVQQQPATVQAKVEDKYGIVSVGLYFGMMFLFSIPIIGWLICLIVAFVPKRQSLKNYARATLIWLIIGLGLAALGFAIFSMLGNVVNGFISDATGGSGIGELFGQFGELSSMTEQFGDLSNMTEQFGDLSNMAEQFGDLSGMAQ